ncbi:hypothetical protein GY45DRAFT_1438773 [Cubamyces sp. BRFM 1775]|nr:hypothetical protein GY45DRAFT_1438773 [Cubamyces sp. BRFM 1775]
MSPVVRAPPKTPCVRCSKTHDTPAAFLMACCRCERAWHHTCHIPPITEQEIMGRMSADERGKRDAGLSAWVCKKCTKRRRVEPPPSLTHDVIEVLEDGVQQQSSLSQVNDEGKGKRKGPPSELPTVIELDDNVEVAEMPAETVFNKPPSPPPPPPPAPLPTPLPVAPVAQSTPFNAKDVRELISTMRAKGQLDPPPAIDYVFSRDRVSRKTSSGRSALEGGDFGSRSRTRDLVEVERKLDDFEDDAMDVDHSGQEPDAYPDPDADPHNIDDLYGDVARRYLNERQSAHPPRRPVAPDAHLLFSGQNRRLAEQQERAEPQELEPSSEQEAARKPRKSQAQRLQGKALRRKQAAGITFMADEVDWGARGAT